MTKKQSDNARQALHSSESNEWYTPAPVVDLVRFIFDGPIHLDPASNPAANETVAAQAYFDVNQGYDGLELRWGRPQHNVFCNPPYGRGTGKWVDKALREQSKVIMLVNAVPGRQWFQDLAESPLTGWIWFFRRRIKFLDPETLEPQDSPTHDSCLVGIGTPAPDWAKLYQYIDDHDNDRLDGYAVLQDDIIFRRSCDAGPSAA